MTLAGWVQIALILLWSWPPPGRWASSWRASSRERTFLSPVLVPVERGFYRAAGVDPGKEQSWPAYTLAMLAFNAIGFLFLYLLQRLQCYLPLNPQGFGAVSEHLAFNTAISFVTNTNWQSYGGETTMGHLVQMAGLTVQNFLSAATGIALGDRRHARLCARGAKTLGNFWVDLTRTTLYVLLPLSIIVALAFAASRHAADIARLGRSDDARRRQAGHRLGPVASQEAIKQLGTNGGGFFNANAAHPFENPSAWANILSIFAMLLVSAALPFMFGRMVGDIRQGRALLIAM